MNKATLSKNLQEIIALDKKLIKFLNKYGSKIEPFLKNHPKLTAFLDKTHLSFLLYSSEKRLNREWKKVGHKFQKKADEIYKRMSNGELLLSMILTKEVFTIIDTIKYFTEIKIDFDKIASGESENLIDEYCFILREDEILKKYAINDYWYEKIKKKNDIENIELFILNSMTNEQIMVLANKSSNWLNKLYYYGFLKYDSN